MSRGVSSHSPSPSVVSADGRPTADRRRCSRCLQVLPLDGFPVDRAKPSGRKSRCRSCCADANREYKALHREELAQKERDRRARAGARRRRELPFNLSLASLAEEARARAQRDAIDPSLTLMGVGWTPNSAPPELRQDGPQADWTEQANALLGCKFEPRTPDPLPDSVTTEEAARLIWRLWPSTRSMPPIPVGATFGGRSTEFGDR